MIPLKIFISGQRRFGEEVLRLCLRQGHNVIGVCCPVDDDRIGRLATLHNIQRVPSGSLTSAAMPAGTDLGLTAHSFDYIGKATRYIPRLGWIGYHPSLLPRHRGRSSIEWAIKMGDPVTGGTIFWLNAGIDRGDIAYQDWVWIPPGLMANPRVGARHLWNEELIDVGLRLYEKALSDISKGVIIRSPQRQDVSTFEPSITAKDIYRPDCLMIEYPIK